MKKIILILIILIVTIPVQGLTKIIVFDNKNLLKNREVIVYQFDNERFIMEINFSQEYNYADNITYHIVISPSEYDVITNPENSAWLNYAVIILVPIILLISVIVYKRK